MVIQIMTCVQVSIQSYKTVARQAEQKKKKQHTIIVVPQRIENFSVTNCVTLFEE